MELNLRREAAIQYPRYRLPKDLNQSDVTEVTIPLWDYDDGLTGALLRKVTLAEGGLDQANSHILL